MNHSKKYFSRNKFSKLITHTLSTVAACLVLASCGSQNDTPADAVPSGEPTKTITPSADSSAADATPALTAEPLSPTPTSMPTYHAVIYDNRSKGTRVELDIYEGEVLDLNSFTQLLGYDFVGCYDRQNGDAEQYIDINGKVCAELVSDLVLYARYEPKTYALNFVCNGESGSQYNIPSINVTYGTNLRHLLPLAKIIDDNKLVYSVCYKDLSLADLASDSEVLLDEATFQDSQIFTDGSGITLDLKTTIISHEAHFGEQEVCIRDDLNQFEQRFKDQYICDSLSFDAVDFNLLENLGYNTATIEVNCQVREKDDGNQEIYVYHAAYEHNENDGKKEKKQKEKAMKDFLLAEESHDCKKQDVAENVQLTTRVPLSKLKFSDGIYVYYGASGFGEDDWYRVFTDIKITFEKIME